MKKLWVKIAAPVLLAVLLCIGYFAGPVRPAIALWTANRYIQRHYQQYDLPSAEIVATGRREFYGLTWITEYGAQSLGGNGYLALVECNGWFPFIVEESSLWKNQELIETAP